MSDPSKASKAEHPEIIFIHRHDDEEHEHHSSAWKVAHADFMTAMMAFFLVMWLINVTDKDVRKAIANYFNPVDLSESVTDRRGLNDPEDAAPNGTSADGKEMSALKETTGEGTGLGMERQRGGSERAAFQDPYGVLAKLAENVDQPQPSSPDVAVGETGLVGTVGGDTARDPFDPVYWQLAPAKTARAEKTGSPATTNAAPAGSPPDAAAPSSQLASQVEPKAEGPMAPEPAATTPSEAPTAETGSPSSAPPAKPSAQEKLAAEIDGGLRKALAETPAPEIEVRATAAGLVISLTDNIDFSMFPIGSAVPDGRLVRSMEKIAAVLKDRPGLIALHGHTDGRPFQSGSYDNWQLSSARAQMAFYMLTRAGVDERRVTGIEGHADRELKNPGDPNSAENRRIEILLQSPAKPEK